MSKPKTRLRAAEIALPLAPPKPRGRLEDWMLRLVRHQSRRGLILLTACELLVLGGSLVAATYLRYHSDAELFQEYSIHLFARSVAFSVLMVLGMAAMGLYQAHLRQSWFGLLARQALGFVVGVLGLIAVYYVIPQLHVGRGALALALSMSFILVAGLRAGFLQIADAELLKRRILVLGAGMRAALIPRQMRRRADRRGFTIVGYVAQGEEAIQVPFDRIAAPDTPLRAWAERHRINEIVVGPDERRGGLPMEELLECKQAGIEIIELATFFERESGKVALSLAEPSWLVFSQGFNTSPIRIVSKRLFDICAALAVLSLTWPLMLLGALAIRLESGAGKPILYRQERVGANGRVFSLIKFRSMRTDAEKDGVARWASKSDDRITRVGRIIRRMRLDELPQLWNVLRGDMSVVGPRPERPEFVTGLATSIRYYNLRHCVRPGLAGWAQLRYPYGASKEDAEEKLKYDLFYVKNHNLLLDILILIQTVEIVLFGRGVR
ncbi:MAG TPA: TIGR03013 family XrtA/PEP-CTERM system glycosyltransferase [Rhodanobacteraceae bacterium]|nr:TIGR03013 family XrtA/PEP-CTERM system glycosyltransferase [Rhodanobacteraceae bacterium]